VENLVEAIRAAVAPDASDATRVAGAQACRTILAALEPQPEVPVCAPSAPADQIGQLLGVMRGIPAEQLLDLAIARLRAALPSGSEAPKVAPLKFHIVQLPGAKR
jgi:hypothetical protein